MNTELPHRAPQIRTERLLLREVSQSDAPAIVRTLSVWDVARNLSKIPFPYGNEDVQPFLAYLNEATARKESLTWAIDLDGYIGCVAIDSIHSTEHGMAGEVGYYLAKPYWGRGIATEAARTVIDYAFTELDAAYLTSGHAADNTASARVLAKLAFVETERGEHFYLPRGQKVPRVKLKLSRQDWMKRR
jgi:RimJ/RimL family protein N-acetyltransferase